MADVLIVCVREDEPQAKALADTFERAGFDVGGAPSSDAALRSSGAAVVVWTQASIRSRPFLDAAQRVVNVDKAVLACLIDPPPPHSINNASAFDVRGWNGDPDDPVLDPLFFAVDRMVNAARAAVGAPAAEPAREQFEAPQSLRPPPSAPPYARAARTAPPQNREPPAAPLPAGFQMRTPRAPAAPAADPLGSEAEHWRAIRHSTDPTAFLDYLARYGSDGAFSELAELRLKDLQRTPARPTARSAPTEPPAARQPPPVVEPRRYDPPPEPRRYDPPPERIVERAPERLPERIPERLPERVAERRYEPSRYEEPPYQERKSGGGALRALFLLLLLGGGALGAGLYFGGDVAPDDAAQIEDVAALTPVGESALAPEGEAAPDTPIQAEELDEPARAVETAARRPTLAPSEEEIEDGPTPEPVRNWGDPAPVSPEGNPVYLGGGAASSPQSAPSSFTPPPAAPPASAPATRPAPAPPPGAVTWARRPSADRIAALYPRRAARDGAGGRVDLDCTVRADLALNCAVARDTAPDYGFGRAALEAAEGYRTNPTLSNGAPAPGARTRIAISFQPPQD